MNETQALAKMVPPSQKRKNAWRGGIIQIHVTRACDKACFGCTQGSNLGGKIGMITPEQFEEAVISLKDFWGVVGIFGGNPCCAAGTPVYTANGIYAIEDLENTTFSVRNARGELQRALCLHRGKKPLYKITLRGGHTYFATAEHEWPVVALEYGKNHKRKDRKDYCPRKQVVAVGKVQTKLLQAGMLLPISKSDSLEFGSDGTADDGFLAGWMLGDGWVGDKKRQVDGRMRKNGKPDMRFAANNGRTHKARAVGMIANATDHGSGITDRLSSKLEELGTEATWRAVKRCQEINIGTAGVTAWMDRFGLSSKSAGLPLAVWTTASEDFRIGVLDGLFSADGAVEKDKRRGYTRIRLFSSHAELVRDVSKLLGFYGIKTEIQRRERLGKFPNGKDYGKRYVSFTLSISGTASIARFRKLVRLTHAEKRSRLDAAAERHTADNTSDTVEIIAVELTDRVEDVWDISVDDDTHTFQLPHCVTGNCKHPQFPLLCELLRKHIPKEQCGLWCNKLFGHGKVATQTFNPKVSNLNVHLDREAYNEFKRDWPGSRPFGLTEDSRHAPVYVAMQDVVDEHGNHIPEEEQWDKIANCDINQNWSSMICVFRNQLRGFFCEIAGAQAMLHQHEIDYPDTGIPIEAGWWKRPMTDFAAQVRLHCKACGVPLRGYGSLAQDESGIEQVSATHAGIYKPKRPDREVQLVQLRTDVSENALKRITDYVQNSAVKKD